MSDIFSKCEILDRIKEHYHLSSNSELAKFLGIANSTLSNWYNRNSIDFDIVFTKCESTDLNWLVGGKKKYVLEDNAVQVVSDFANKYDKKHKLQVVPLYRMDPTAGMTALFMDDRQQKPVGHIDIPNLPKCDGATYIVGDSMYPLLKSGDIILYKKIHADNIRDIIPGEMYMIDIDMNGDDYITVKYIHRSEIPDHVKLVSQNQHHDPVEVDISRIRGIALVKASIRFNTLR